jgi:hypothetical protein
MTDHSEHLTAFAVLNSSGFDIHEAETVEEWSVWNDPEFFNPRFASGEVHPALKDKILGEPLFTSEVPGAAKRFLLWTNEQRRLEGKLPREGAAILRMRPITHGARRKVEGLELEEIDEGRRANG